MDASADSTQSPLVTRTSLAFTRPQQNARIKSGIDSENALLRCTTYPRPHQRRNSKPLSLESMSAGILAILGRLEIDCFIVASARTRLITTAWWTTSHHSGAGTLAILTIAHFSVMAGMPVD